MGSFAELVQFTENYLRLGLSQGIMILMAWFLMKNMFVQRRKAWLLVVSACYLMFGVNWMVNGYLRIYYVDQEWWQALYGFMLIGNTLLHLGAYYYILDGGFLEISICMVLADLLSTIFNVGAIMIVNRLENRQDWFIYDGKFMLADLLIPVIQFAIYGIFMHFFGRFLRKYARHRIKHRFITGTLLLLYIFVAFLSRCADFEDYAQVHRSVLFAEVVGGAVVGVIVYSIFQMYIDGVARKNDYLKHRNSLMKAHYITLQQQIRHIERSRARNNEKMEKILQMQEGWQGEGLENYLKDLKRQYENIAAGIYCEDWAVDAMLTNLAALCRKKEIRPDFQFQKYDRGEIQEEDILQFLRSLGEAAIRASGEGDAIRIQAAAVKNQLMFTCTCPAGKRILEKDHRELIEKYQGSFQGSVKGNVQMVSVMLQRENIVSF